MNAELQSALIDKLKLALEEFRAGKLKVSLEDQVRKTHLKGDEKRTHKLLFLAVQKKLLKTRQWKDIQAALAFEAFQKILRAFLREQAANAKSRKVTAAKERQLEMFPGYENLPVRVRQGKVFVELPQLTVGEFQSYVGRYLGRVAKTRRVADDLERLAEFVRPIAERTPTISLADAFERQSRKIAVLPARVEQL